MANTSKFVPQQTAPSSFNLATDAKVAVPEVAQESPFKSFVPGVFSIKNDFNIEKSSSQQGQGEGEWRYICSVTEETLATVLVDCNWEGKEVVILRPNEYITIHVEGT